MNYNNSMIAFSGGKDSIAVSKYIRSMGYRPIHVAIVDKELDYKEHLDYIKEYCESVNVPLDMVYMNLGIDYLLKHPEYILPEETKIQNKWYKLFQQEGIRKYSEKHNYDMVIFGRRLADMNSIKSKKYKTKNGIIQYFPIREWSNKKTWDYIADQKLSPIYTVQGNNIQRGANPFNISVMVKDKGKGNKPALDFIKKMSDEKYKLIIELLKYKKKKLI